MKQKHQIEREVEETLSSLNGLRRATPKPFLFTRVQARMQQTGKSAWERLTAYLARPAIAMAVLMLVLLSNSAVMYWQSKTDDMASNEQPQPALTEEYALASSFYEDENP
ncbi:MAG TPA: hypothetical protein VD996_08125 [Chitinophagaceae bacterium]|nr:hypothetical protein [Chitinophagaceae bacterium]